MTVATNKSLLLVKFKSAQLLIIAPYNFS